MDQLSEIWFEDRPSLEGPAMERLKAFVVRADEVEASIKKQEQVLKDYMEEHRMLTTRVIPGLMTELGELSEVKSSWGTVKLTPFWSGKITPETQAKAFAWLDENGHGGIVKREFVVSIMKGDDRHAEEVRDHLNRANASFEEKQGVHHQTLQGLIRAMAKAGTPVPQDLFNVYSGTVAKVTVTKE